MKQPIPDADYAMMEREFHAYRAAEEAAMARIERRARIVNAIAGGAAMFAYAFALTVIWASAS